MYDVRDSGAGANRDAGSGVAVVVTTSLASDVEAMLRVVRPELNDHDMIVLPPYQREGHSFYDDDDLDAVRLARDVGINAIFLHGPKDREYLQEYTAGYVVEFAIALGANLAAIGLTPLVNYVIARARHAVHHGLHDGPEGEVPVRLTVAQLRRDRNGKTRIKGLKIEGPAADVGAALRELLGTQSPELEAPSEVTPDRAAGRSAVSSSE